VLTDVKYPKDGVYRTGSKKEPYQYYFDSLLNSNSLDLLLGYFSSSAINILSFGFAYFLYRGGKVRMVINHVLNEVDSNIVREAKSGDIVDYSSHLESFDKLKVTLDEYGQHFFRCLAWLIANDRIEILIVKPLGGNGIAHYKSGIFSDGKNQVHFKASCNFTAFGLLNNLEEVDIHTSWASEREVLKIKSQIAYFEEIQSGVASFVKYVDNLDEIKVAIQKQFGGIEIEDLIKESTKLRNKKKLILDSKCKEQIAKIEKQILEEQNSPKFPYSSKPRDYQIEAYQKWIENDKKGIFAMATGTGKTITSLNCLLQEYRETKTYKAVIVVPTIALINQWEKECHKFNFTNIIKISSKEKWESSLAGIHTSSLLSIQTSFIIIVTYASFYRKKFQTYFHKTPKETLLIADEVHNIGTSKILKALPTVHLEKRIGLSATPKRYFDEVGDRKIEVFFNDAPPFVYNFSMKKALEMGWLCPYTYYPHLVELDEIELKEYRKISLQLMKFFDPKTNSYKKCKEVEALLMKRKRVIHKAKNKLVAFKKIMQSEFKKNNNLKYTLVYVPEGNIPNYANMEEYIEEEEDVKLINDYTREVSKIDDSIMVKQYTAKTKNRDNIIKKFDEGKIDVLTSMKCLDEGVDVPKAKLAIFCASTGNSRQFIQRRGRVLRLHRGKTHAIIHDLVVVPKINENESTYNMEKSLVGNELRRVKDFFLLSLNSMDTYRELKEVLEYYNLSLYNN